MEAFLLQYSAPGGHPIWQALQQADDGSSWPEAHRPESPLLKPVDLTPEFNISTKQLARVDALSPVDTAICSAWRTGGVLAELCLWSVSRFVPVGFNLLDSFGPGSAQQSRLSARVCRAK